MAELKVFGMPGCARCQGVKQYLANTGQNVRVGDSADLTGFEAAIRKALTSRPVSELMVAEKATWADLAEPEFQIDSVAENLTKHPELLVAPLVVRGHQVVVANRHEQAGSLRY